MKVADITTKSFWKGEYEIKGRIEDAERSYRTKLHVKGSRIYDYSCSCTAGSSYRGMCGHCDELWKAFRIESDKMNQKPVLTTPSVRIMVREYTNREVARIVNREEEGEIRLIPKLNIGRHDVKVEFSIGRDRMYVLRDLVAFTKSMNAGSYEEYGKQLAFHHTLDAFEQKSRLMAELVMELVTAYQEYFEQFQKSSFVVIPPLRELVLNQAGRDRMLELLMEQSLEIDDGRGSARRIFVTRENPHLLVTAEQVGHDGICVGVDSGIKSFRGKHNLYVLDGPVLYQCDDGCSQCLEVFLQQMLAVYGGNGQVDVQKKDIPLFYERVLKTIEPYVQMKDTGISWEEYRPEELKVEFRFDSSSQGTVTMEPMLSYGDVSFSPSEDEKLPRSICRDVPGEFLISQVITKYFKYKDPEGRKMLIQDDENALYNLLEQGMPEFMALGQIYLSESFKQLKILPPPKISMGVTMGSGWLTLDIDGGDLSGEELSRILSSYSQKKRFYRMDRGEFLELDNQGLFTVAKLAEDLGITGDQLKSGQLQLPSYRALYLDQMFKDSQGLSVYRDHLFRSVVRGMKSIEDSEFEVPAALKPILRIYQKTGFRWLRTLDRYGFGGILADDMGLGKTVQVITMLLDEKQHAKGALSLVICPASLVYNWNNEINTFAPQLNSLMVIGNAGERQDILERVAAGRSQEDGGEYPDVLITSYDLLKRDVQFYEQLDFRFQIIDEAQYIKNASTQSAKAVKSIQAKRRFALTGTPIENRLGELWSIMDYLMPGLLFSYSQFKKELELPIVKEQSQEKLKSLHRMIGPFILRRVKTDVLKELPEKLETVIYSGFEPEQKEIYTANAQILRDQLEGGGMAGGDKLQILAGLTKLRQICCDPRLCYENYRGGSAKLETCIEMLISGTEGGHRILLFSQFTSMLELIGQRLKAEGILYYTLIGATSKEERQQLVHDFGRTEVQVFLISLKAGGTGLNLAAADMVIHYDPWWNEAAQNQATDRAHRIGQKKQVTVLKLITKGTLEENILKLQQSKKNLSDQVITEGTVSLSSLTKEDLMQIML